jgi:hypothetical protein
LKVSLSPPASAAAGAFFARCGVLFAFGADTLAFLAALVFFFPVTFAMAALDGYFGATFYPNDLPPAQAN